MSFLLRSHLKFLNHKCKNDVAAVLNKNNFAAFKCFHLKKKKITKYTAF